MNGLVMTNTFTPKLDNSVALFTDNQFLNSILTIEETAKIFKVKATTLRTWINRNKIPKDLYKKIGGTIRFSRRAIEEYMNI